MAIASNFPSSRPSLLLDFANVGRLDPRVTFARASTATYFDQLGVLQSASNGVARFDHDPVTGESKGLLIEEQRTNLLTRSIPDAAVPTGWLVGFSTGTFSHTLVAATTPYAGLQQFIKNDQTVSGRSFLEFNLTLSANTTYTLTVIFNKATSSITSGDATVVSIANLSDATGTLTISFSSVPDSGIARLTFTTGADTTGQLRIGCGCLFNTVASLTFGAWQLEAGAFATSYIPTTTTALTRSADAASMTGTNFSEWFNAAEGTIFASSLFLQPLSTTGSRIVAISDNTNNNRLQLSTSTISGGNVNFLITDAGVAQANPLVGSISTAGPHKSAGAYATNSVQVAANGTLGTEDTSATIPTNVNVLNLGTTGNPNTIGNLWLQRIAYYPVKLSSAQLQALTG